jgi:AcrR family transcriptional regulator
MDEPIDQAATDEARASSRQARRQRRRDQSRDEILEAARRVLIRSGVAATTLEAVAREAGMSKTGLYYYFPSKDALLFELVFAAFQAQSQAVHEAVEAANDGGAALSAIVRETVRFFGPRLDDFRLAFLQGQIAGPGALRWTDEQFRRIRPLNDLLFAGAAERLSHDRVQGASRADVAPRMMAFLAYVAALGVLTMKGMVESVDDPLIYSDEELAEALARVFSAAASAP